MRMFDMIEKKKQGQAMTMGVIEEMIRLFVADEIPDYQMAAWAMAVCF